MQDKHSFVRNHLLDLLENGELNSGDKFPGARQLAKDLGVSFLLVQHVVNCLVQDGVLLSVPRRGVYVRKLWKARRLWNHFTAFGNELPYFSRLKSLMAEELPELRCCTRFHSGIFEIRPTLSVQCNREAYLDLAGYADFSDGRYFSRPFSGFRDNSGRLFGIPLLWSPRILLYRKDVLKKHGIERIPEKITFDEFICMVGLLKQKLPAEKICNYCDVMSFYMNMIFSAGGMILEQNRNGSSEVKLDSPETLRGVSCLRRLRNALQLGNKAAALSLHDKNEMAFLFADREIVCKLNCDERELWGAMPLPVVEGGKSRVFQSTELICVRRECTDESLVKKFVSFMLGSRVQNIIGETGYGIPILRSAAEKSLDMNNAVDRLFSSEAKRTGTGAIDSREIMGFAYNALFKAVICEDESQVHDLLKRSSDAMRIVCDMRSDANYRQAVHLYERDAAAFNLEAIAFDR